MKGFKYSSYLLFLLLLCTIHSCSTGTAKSKNTDQPNLFLFLADDLSYSDLGVTGNTHVNTSNIDKFANESIAFTRMYTPSAMCAPSRSALFTGLYPHRNGCHMNHGTVYSDIKSLPNYLKEQGYKVALVGKQHIKPKEVFSFDYVKPEKLSEYLTTVNQPLCLIYASNDPHGPHVQGMHDPAMTALPLKWQETPKTREKLAGYYADIAVLDKEFQSFIDTIGQHGLDKNAITIFTSDHGYDFFAKWSCYEDGLHVPFFLKSTTAYNFKSQVDNLTSFIDILPTFIELSGGQSVQDIDGKSLLPSLNGSSTAGHEYIYGVHTTRGIYSGFNYPIRSITDGRWKYIRNLNSTAPFQNIITNGWDFDPADASPAWTEWLAAKNQKSDKSKWVSFYQHRPEEELYDLSKDPAEMKNLAIIKAHFNIKKGLSLQLDKWMAEQEDMGVASEVKVPLKARDMSRVPVN